jgi:hypothetical protein
MRHLVLSMTFATILFGFSSAFAADPVMKADAQSIDTACVADAATAKCGADQVGTGLLKCLHAYKKANHTFKFSSGCKEAMQQMHKDRKAGK